MDGRTRTDAALTEKRDWRSCSSFCCRCQNFLHASWPHRPSPLRAKVMQTHPPLVPYWRNMGIGFGPNLIPSGKLACQPARQREERRGGRVWNCGPQSDKTPTVRRIGKRTALKRRSFAEPWRLPLQSATERSTQISFPPLCRETEKWGEKEASASALLPTI